MRLLLWAAIGFVIAIWICHIKKTAVRSDFSQRKKLDGRHENSEAMIRCAYCEMHLPVSEAVIRQSNILFCSEEHCLQYFQSRS
jgi:hypothetical protein